MNFNYIETLVAKAKNGDVSAKEIIFKEFRPMILNISKRTFVHGYEFSDIEHECYATLLKCIKIYDLDKKRFVAYATMAIKNNINYLIKRYCNRSCNVILLRQQKKRRTNQWQWKNSQLNIRMEQ